MLTCSGNQWVSSLNLNCAGVLSDSFGQSGFNWETFCYLFGFVFETIVFCFMHKERAKEEATGNKLKSSHLDLLRSLNRFFF